MSQLPGPLERARHLDLEGRSLEVWARRAGIAVLLAILGIALAGMFGQRGKTWTASGPAATIRLDAPGALRSGLMYQARFEIEALRPIERPLLVLQDGWLEGMTLNSLQPAPVDETERNGYLALGYARLDAGDTMTVFAELQANPTTTGRRAQAVLLEDGGEVVARIDREITVFP